MKSESNTQSIQTTTPHQTMKPRQSNHSNAQPSPTDEDNTTSSDLYQKIYKMHYEDEMTLTEIAEKLNMHRCTVGDIFKKNGWSVIRRAGRRSKERYPVNFWYPEVNGIRIQSVNHLLDCIQSRNPGILSLENISDLVRQAEVHLEIIQRYSERGYILHGEVYRLSGEFNVPAETLRYLLRRAGRPRIYYLLEQASMDSRIQTADEARRILNGVDSIEEMDRRFRSLYFYREIVKSSNHSQYRSLSVKYFRFWKEYLRGALCTDIAKRLDIGISTITEWLKFAQIPTHATYASKIPKEAPKGGWKWLPLKLNIITNTPESFIQVPERITSLDDLLEVLDQIAPLNTLQVRNSAAHLSPLPRHLEFMYLLGLIASDGGFSHNIEHSANVQLYVGTKYSWGLGLGEAFCYAMGILGFKTERWADDVRYKYGKKQVCMVWGCETSPFFAWIEKALFGLEFSSAKTYQHIKAEWILKLPREWRVAFVQGLADGDGYASIRTLQSGICTTTNQALISRLLETLGVVSRCDSITVRITRQKANLDANMIPLFRYAFGRQKRLTDVSNLICTIKRRHLSDSELRLIIPLLNQGYNPGEITEILWYKSGIARSPGCIYHALFKKESHKLQ